MLNFYQNLESNLEHFNGEKAKALREATLVVMKDQRYRHPLMGWLGVSWQQ